MARNASVYVKSLTRVAYISLPSVTGEDIWVISDQEEKQQWLAAADKIEDGLTRLATRAKIMKRANLRKDILKKAIEGTVEYKFMPKQMSKYIVTTLDEVVMNIVSCRI